MIKIYFGDKPLFLNDKVTADIETFLHHDDAVFIDELSAPAVNSMIHEMQTGKVHAGIFVHKNLDDLKRAVWKKFTVIQAAGGLVINEKEDVLFIFRRGKWDLPKGKLEEGEDIVGCAVREVIEETGLKEVEAGELLLTTYHTYHEKGKFILKESFWYRMQASSRQKLIPQEEEDITESKWIAKSELQEVLRNTFPSIKDVVAKITAG